MKLIKELINRLTYRAEWSDEDQLYIAYALEIPSVKAHASTPEEAIKEVKTPIKLALGMMVESKQKLPMPFSSQNFKGNLTLRTTPETHKKLAMAAAESNVSINQYILSKLF